MRRFVGHDAAFPDIDAAVAHLRAVLPPLSLDGDEAWRAMAALTYAPDGDGVLRPVWDTRIARLMNGRTPDLWPLFGGLAHLPLLLVRGEASDILLPATVARMQAVRPDMLLATLPGIGHAPTLTEPEMLAALRAFLDGVDVMLSPAGDSPMTPSRLIASGFGCGFAPFAPGTVASAATLLPGALLLHFSPCPACCRRTARDTRRPVGDPRGAGRRRSRLGGDR